MVEESSTPLFSDQIQPLTQLRADYLSDRLQKLVKHLVKLNLENGGLYYETDEYDNSIEEIKNQTTKIPYISDIITPYVIWVANRYMKNYYGVDLQVFEFKKTKISEVFQLEFSVNANTEKNISLIYMFIVTAFSDKFCSNKKNKLVINQLQNVLN